MLRYTVNILWYLQKTNFKSSLLQFRPVLITEVMGEFEILLVNSICFWHPFLSARKGLWGEMTSRMMGVISHHSSIRSFQFMGPYTIQYEDNQHIDGSIIHQLMCYICLWLQKYFREHYYFRCLWIFRGWL